MIYPSSAPGSKPSQTNPGSADPRGTSVSNARSSELLYHVSPTVTAVMVDAGFYLTRAQQIFGKLLPDDAARKLHKLALDHLNDDSRRRVARLYRIFVYDAAPACWKGHTPIDKKAIDLGKSATAKWRNAFHDALRGLRKVALRMGEIPTSQVRWQIKPDILKNLLNGKQRWDELTDNDFRLESRTPSARRVSICAWG